MTRLRHDESTPKPTAATAGTPPPESATAPVDGTSRARRDTGLRKVAVEVPEGSWEAETAAALRKAVGGAPSPESGTVPVDGTSRAGRDTGPRGVVVEASESAEAAAKRGAEAAARREADAEATSRWEAEAAALRDVAGEAFRDESEEGEALARRRPSVRLRRAAVAVLAAALVLTGCGFFYGAHQLRSTASARNRALTDTEATTRVAGDIGTALARVFSYTPDGLDAAERSARSVLDGRAARQYTELLGRIRAQLTEQRVTLSTQAVRVGVIELDGHSARLLVFLDQVSRRDNATATMAAAQLTVTARWEHDQWRIVDIRTR
ncbi:hypothetical protein ACWEKM_39305 [Streptomyces sp. NPDC004752]